MAGHQYSDEEGATLSDINVTPLVDVVLVLLIVFMITVPAIVGSAHIKVDLPETRAAELAVEKVPLHLFLRRNEAGAIVLYLDDKPTTLDELKALVKRTGGAKDQVVSFSSDRNLPYGDVVKVIDELGAMGLHKMSLNTRNTKSGQ
ncbi:MAG: biopolymer transporter ExbD [Planctomycetia bacterium]|nr:biopolymer transporter ExbD [Planctomycetia bacterium]